MRPSFVNFHGDPFNSDAIAEYTHVQSDGYGGAHEDLTAPAAANFPMVTPTRYFLYLPFVPDQDDLGGARPFLLKDVTGGVALTRVSGAPAANQYRLSPDDSRVPCVVELNSGQAGHAIAYDYYAIGSIAEADDFNNPEVTGDLTIGGDVIGDLTVTGNISGGNHKYRNTLATETQIVISEKIIEIGAWDMLANGIKDVDHGLADWTKIIHVDAIIINDAAQQYTMISYFGDGGAQVNSSGLGTSVRLSRSASGIFYSTNYDHNTMNRGWVVIKYLL